MTVFIALPGIADQLDSVAYSPDGRYIASGARNGEADPVGRERREEVRRFAGHNDSVNSLAFSPDSQTLLSGSTDWVGVLECGDRRRNSPHRGRRCLTPSPTARTAKLSSQGWGGHQRHADPVGCQYRDGDSPLYRSSSADHQRRLQPGWANLSIRFAGSEPAPVVREQRGGSTAHPARYGVESAALSPDGQLRSPARAMAASSLSNLTTGGNPSSLEGHTDIVRSVAFTPDGQTAYRLLSTAVRCLETCHG